MVGREQNKLQIIKDDKMLVIVNLGDGHMEFIISLFTSYMLKISIIEK